MSKQHLITITTSSHGLDFIVHGQAMDNFLVVDEPKWSAADQQQMLVDIRNERRVMLAEEFRQLARKLEAGAWPFSRVSRDDDISRGAAEREIDRLALHIQRLQAGVYQKAYFSVDEDESRGPLEGEQLVKLPEVSP